MAAGEQTESAAPEALPVDTVFSYADKIAKENGVDPSLVRGIIYAENSGNNGKLPNFFRSDRVSPKGAYGIGQTMTATHRNLITQGKLPSDHSLDSWQGQVEATVAAIKDIQQTHKTTDPTIVAAAYNGGNAAGKNAAAGKYDALPTETVNYLEKLAKMGLTGRTRSGQIGGTQPSQGDVRTVDQMATDAGVPNPQTVPPTQIPNVGITSITTTENPTRPRNAFERGIDALMELTRQNSTILNNLIGEVSVSTEAAALEHEKAAASVEAAGVAQGQAETVKSLIEAAGADTRQRVLRISNMDTRVADNAFSKALADRAVIRTDRERLAAEIDQRKSIGFFDNPLDWLVNQTILPGQIAEHNALARKERDNIDLVTILQNQVKAQENLDMGATADLYLKLGNNVAAAEVAKAQAKAAEFRATSGALRAQKILSIAGLRERQVGLAESALKYGALLEERGDKANLKADEIAQRDDLDKRLKVIGDFVAAPGMNIVSLKGRGKDVQNDWVKRADTLTLGDNLGESMEFIRKYGDIRGMRNQGVAELADLVKATQDEISRRATEIRDTWALKHPDQANKVPKDVEAREQAAQTLQWNWESQRDNNMLLANAGNPYRANHNKQAITWKGNPKNVVYQMAKDAQERGQRIDDKILIGAVSKLVEAGTIQPREAASALQDYYSDVVRKNNTDRSLKVLGLDEQKVYRVRPDPQLRSFDLTNFAEAENFFTQLYTKNITGRGVVVPEGYEYIPYPRSETMEAIFGKVKPGERQEGMIRRKEVTNPAEELSKREKERRGMDITNTPRG